MEQRMNPDEIIAALRICNNPKGHRCSVCPILSRYEHGVCKRTVDRASADLLASQQSRIAELEAQLAASQRREGAAVEDLQRANFCSQCQLYETGRCNGLHKRGKCADWQWRGPQEAGKGDVK